MQNNINRSVSNGVTGNSLGGARRVITLHGERRVKPHNHDDSFKCPRCESDHTKFCYYNNYNLSQPRFFCKSCRRYWTQGGVLRNVPVGGRCRRKTKRLNRNNSLNRTPPVPELPVPVPVDLEQKTSGSQNSSNDVNNNNNNNNDDDNSILTEAAVTVVDQGFEAPLLNQCSSATDNVEEGQLLSEMGMFRSLMLQQDEVDWNLQQWTLSGNGGATAEEWGLFDQSYWLNQDI